MDVAGRGRRRFLIVGNYPSSLDDSRGKHFQDDAGSLLRSTLARNEVNLDKDCWKTNALICRPTKATPYKTEMIDYCRPNLVKTIQTLQPEVIIPIGTDAVKSVLRYVYKEDDIGDIFRWAGYRIPCQKINTWIAPILDPTYVLNSTKNPVPGIMFREQIAAAAQLEGRPWGDEAPDWKSEVELIMSPGDAAEAILWFMDEPLIAFDYETTTLKPEYEGAAILCCSISNGVRTIAYPWVGEAVSATLTLLRSKRVEKIASNLKFEERWTRHVFNGCGVRRWKWDTMVAAHVLDNRPKTTSIKFQSFVHLGAESYDDHIKPFLRVKGQKTNSAKKDINLQELLVYNGLDSLLEYKVAEIQMSMIGENSCPF